MVLLRNRGRMEWFCSEIVKALSGVHGPLLESLRYSWGRGEVQLYTGPPWATQSVGVKCSLVKRKNHGALPKANAFGRVTRFALGPTP